MTTPFMPPNSVLSYINNNGQATQIISIGDGSGDVTRIGPDGKVITPAPGQVFPLAPDYVQIILYPDGNIKQYESNHADGSGINLQFADTNLLSLFGPDNGFSHGPLTESTVTTASGLVIDQKFSDGHLTDYSLTFNDINLIGHYNPATNTSTLSLQNNTHTTPLTNSGVGNIDALLKLNSAAVISNDGGSVISHDGGTLITQDGASLIGQDGASIDQLQMAKLIGQDGASLIGQDGASLLSEGGAGIFSGDHGLNDAGAFSPNDGSDLSGSLGAEFAANFMAHAALGVSHYSLASFTPPGPTPFHWVGGSGDWTDGSHWSHNGTTGTVPGTNDQAIVDAGGTYTVTLDSSQSVYSLTVNAAKATVADGASGVLNVGAGLTLGAGTFQLQQGGTIVGGTLSATGGHFVWNGGTLDASTYLGNLDLSAANAKLHIADGLTAFGSGGVGPGTILLTGAGSQLFFDGTQAFDNAVIQFGSTAKGAHIERLWSNDPSHVGNVVLTLAPGVTINQTGASVEMDSGNASGDGFDIQGIINANRAAGLFVVNANSFTNEGSIKVASGDVFSLNGVSITNKSNIAVTTGGQATITDNNFTNTASGTITVDGAKSSLTFSGGWTNAGTIAIANGGSVHAAGPAATADLGTIVNPDTINGGTFFIDGTLDNTGATLDLSGDHYGKVVLTGTITSGTITDPSSDLSFSGNLATLDGVTVTSPLQLSAPGSKVTITHGITANSGGAGDGEIDIKAPFSTLEFDGTQSVDHVVINLGSTASGTHTENLNAEDFSFANQTVAFGANATINQTGVSVLFSTHTGAGVTFNGTLNANIANGFFGIETDTFTLNGTMNVGNGDFLAIDDLVPPGSTFTNNGTIVIDGGRMRIASQTLNGTGTITIDADGVLFLGHNAAGQTVNFGPTGGELALEQPAAVDVASGNPVNITGIAAGDQLDLEGIGLAKSATYDGNVLTVTKKDNTVLQFNVQGLAPNNPFIITKDAFGNGSLITAASQDVTWKTGQDGDFAVAGNWVQNRVPGSGDNAMITAAPLAPSHSYTVSSTANESVFTLGTVKGATLDIGNATTFTVLNGTGTGTRANLGTIKVEDGSTLAVGGPINNGGAIDLHSTGGTTTLELLGNVALSGKGSITLDDPHSRIIGNGSPVNLTNTNVISGTGTIGDAALNLINKATITATGTSPLVINAGRGVANSGSLLAQGTGGLGITNTAVTNTSSGKLSALAGSHIDLNGASIIAGTLSGPINVLGTGNLLDGSTKQGAIVAAVENVNVATITDGASLTLAGTIKNGGTFALNSTGDHTELAIKGSVTLSGPGKVTLSDDDHNVIDSNGASASLLNTQAISGAGTIGDHFLQMINKGTITATDNAHDLVITGDVPFSNFNLLDANGGDLVIKNAFIDQTSSSKATIEGDAPSSSFAGTVELNNASIKGGSLRGTFATTALKTSTLIGTAVAPLTISSTKTGLNGTLQVVNNSNLELIGTIKNLGAITVNPTGASLVISGEVTLQGPPGGPSVSKGVGVITLLPGSSLVNDNRDAVLDNEGNSIRCAGVIGNSSPTAQLTINNISGDITATNVMMLEPAAVNNSAIIAAAGGAQLQITNTTITNAFQQPGKAIGKGTVETTASGALILLTAANIRGLSVTTGTGAKAKTTITGGKVITVADSTIEATGSATSTISNQAVTNNGTLLASSGNLIINSAVTNNGILEASSNTPLNGLVQTNGRLSVSGAVTGTGHAIIDGTGEFEINGAFSQNATFDPSATGVLRIDQAALFKGSITGFGLSNAPSAVIDLANVKYISGTTTKSYNTTTGVLTIDDHQGDIANLKFLGGPYTLGNFNIADDGTGHVKLTDPPAEATTPSTSSASPHSLGLLGNYIASSFVTGGAGHGGSTLIQALESWSPQPPLAHPHAT